MNKIEQILKSDFILSFATFLEEETLKNAVLEAIKNNNSKFIYMHPIDNTNLKSFYTQLIKYEVGSEEGICALLLNSFTSLVDEKTKDYQIIGTEKIHFSDQEEVEKYIKEHQDD